MHHDLMAFAVPQFKKQLEAMKGYFTKAAQHADAKKYDVNTLLTARLAPDMYPLWKQVHVTCFLTEEVIGRAAGKVPAPYEGESKTVAELTKRIDHTLSYLSSVKQDDFKGWEERPMDIFFAPDKFLPGSEYVPQLGIPNVFFHMMSVYSILRHNGVDVGKMDYLGPVAFREKRK